MKKNLIRILLALTAAALTGNALAQTGGYAMTEDKEGKTWAANAPTQKEANELAVKICQKESKAQGCRIINKVAMAAARGKTRIGTAASESSLVDAKASALKRCNADDCEFYAEDTTPGFYAMAAAKNEQGGFDYIHLARSYATYRLAVDNAKKKCEEGAGRKCEVVWDFAIANQEEGKKTAAPSGSATPAQSNQTAQKKAPPSCRPNTDPIRCKSYCENGNCTVTYENGCKMRVTVQPKYDPFNNRWDYLAPAC